MEEKAGGPDQTAIRGFAAYLRVERGLAANTVESYCRDLTRLAAYLDEQGSSLAKAGPALLTAHIHELTRQGLSPASLARAEAAFRTFYRFLREEGGEVGNPAQELLRPRQTLRLPRTLDQEQVKELLEAVRGQAPAELRDRAMLELMYACGLRVSELVKLNLENLHLPERYVRCLGKGSRERIVPVGEKAAQALTVYLE
ncbi:MAG TPA: site-specific integrase, partial [Firmicutes bacterium]|nr:site-specific integrase [Bacillota bacterium]